MADFTCAICGFTDPAVRPAVIQWIDKTRGAGGWDGAPRCVDHGACHDRVNEAGRLWPVIEGDSYNPQARGKGDLVLAGRDAARRKAEYAAYLREHPGMTDPKPPVEVGGRFEFQKPRPLPAIPTVAPPVATVSRDEQEEWW